MNLGPAVPRWCGRRPLMTRLKVGVGLAVGLGLGLLAGPLPAAQAGTGVAGRAPSAPPLRIVDTSTFVPADGTFSFGVDTADLRLTDELAWTVHSLIPNTTEAIESALDGEPGPPLRSEQRATIAELGLVGGQVPDSTPGDGRRSATVTIPVRSKAGDSDRVFLPDAGIYPVSVRLLRDGDELDTATLPLIRLGRSPTDRPRLVHLIRTISGGPSLQLDGAAKPSTGDLTELRALTEQLATVPADADASALSVSLPAELLDTLAIAGSPEEAQVVDGLAKVADRATWLSSPYVPLNLGVWAAADVAQNPALTISYDVAQRRLSDLLDVEVNDALVPPDWTLAAPTVGFLADRGATTVLLDPNVVRSGDQPGAATSVEGTTVNAADRRTRQTEQPEDTNTGSVKASLPALTVSDFDLTTESDRSDADPDTNPTVDAVGVARQLALLSAAPLANEERLGDPTDGSDADRPTGPFDVVALRVPDSLADGQLGALVASLSEATGVLAPVDADGLVKALGRASSASRSSGGPPKESEVVLRNATVTQFGALEFATYRGQQAVNAASTLDPGNEAVELAQRQLLVAPHLGLSPDESEAYALAGRGGAQAVLDSVSLGDLSTITLAARRSKVPFRFRNELADPVTVSLRVQSDRLKFTDADPDGRIELTLPPGASTSEVSVEVVTSGVFSVTADVLTPTGSDVIERQEFQVRSRAFSGVGVTLSVASLAVLALWWIRTARAKRHAEGQ